MLTRPKSEQRYWTEYLKNIEALVVGPGDDVDTYQLIQVSDLILTFGSTVGVEAIAMGKPSIIIGKALYSGFNLPIEIGDPKEIDHYLDNLPRVTSESLEQLKIYCYFQLYGGIRFKYLKVKQSDLYKFNPTLYYKGKKAFSTDLGMKIFSKLLYFFQNPLPKEIKE